MRDGVAAALQAVWLEHRPAVFQRLEVIEQVATALEAECLEEELRSRAEREAHKLAGSLGTFGFMTGTERARELELLLAETEALVSAGPAVVSYLVGELRGDLDGGPGVGLPEAPAPSRSDRPLLDIVDDDTEGSRQLAAEARRRGMDVRVHECPVEARQALRGRPPAAVLLDLTFPDGVGESYELLSELSGQIPPVPVLVQTVRESFVDRVEVARRGGLGFLPKTLRPSQVIDAVSDVLDRARSNETRVLVVDDDAAMLAAVRATLEPEGITVTTLAEPMAFWDVLEEVSPDLLILDVDMPDVNGLELCRVVRNDARWVALPILFLTARNDAVTIDGLFSEGADDYLNKPIVGSELRVRIVNRLERLHLYRKLADTDGLTGLRNRRNSSDALEQLARMAARHGQPLCLAELDLDHFKQINDRYGHAAGDAVLGRLGKMLLESFRGEDVVGRWGGEEFVVGMYGLAREDGVRRVAELLESMREQEFMSEGERYGITFSAGVAQYPDDGSSLHELYRAADNALYAAKQGGRDRVVPTGWRPDRALHETDVLIVDDDDTIAELLERALATRGLSTRRYADGAAAATALTEAEAEVRARVMLLDVDLPGLDGFSLLEQLSKHGALRRTRVIMLTSRAGETDVLRALELGAFDHVSKPFSVPVLMHRIHRALVA